MVQIPSRNHISMRRTGMILPARFLYQIKDMKYTHQMLLMLYYFMVKIVSASYGEQNVWICLLSYRLTCLPSTPTPTPPLTLNYTTSPTPHTKNKSLITISPVSAWNPFIHTVCIPSSQFSCWFATETEIFMKSWRKQLAEVQRGHLYHWSHPAYLD